MTISDFGMSSAGFSGAFGAGAGAAFVSGTLTEETSSPSSARTAITALTFTPSVPAGTSSFATVPSSTASTSIVALSVSISAMTSPEEIVSPSLTSHLDSVPSSIVGESAGMVMLMDMVSCPLTSRSRP